MKTISPVGKKLLKRFNLSINGFKTFKSPKGFGNKNAEFKISNAGQDNFFRLFLYKKEWLVEFQAGRLHYSEQPRAVREGDDKTAILRIESMYYPETYLTVIENEKPEISELIEFASVTKFLKISGHVFRAKNLEMGDVLLYMMIK